MNSMRLTSKVDLDFYNRVLADWRDFIDSGFSENFQSVYDSFFTIMFEIGRGNA